jgi:hypothetical protein
MFALSKSNIMTQTTIQIITDFMVQFRTGKVIHITYRNNSIHRDNISLGMTGEVMNASYKQLYVNSSDVDKWLGEELNLYDFYGSYIMTGKIVAKRQRVWDFSKPYAERCLSEKTSKEFSKWFNEAAKNKD